MPEPGCYTIRYTELPPTIRRKRKPRYPFADMLVGGHFEVPLSGVRAPAGHFKTAAALSTAARTFASKEGEGKRFTIRTFPEEGVVKCFRIK